MVESCAGLRDECVYDPTPPSQPTNGDLILEMLRGHEDCVYPVGTDKMAIKVSTDWWNTPYEARIQNDNF